MILGPIHLDVSAHFKEKLEGVLRSLVEKSGIWRLGLRLVTELTTSSFEIPENYHESKRAFYDKYGSFGLFMADQMGEENAELYLRLNNPCLRCLLVTCFILTGCCCCLCCCFCCSCCRTYKEETTPDPEDLFERPEDEDVKKEEEAKVVTSQPEVIALPFTGDAYPSTAQQNGPSDNLTGNDPIGTYKSFGSSQNP
ncbi:unnamed protein product [Schistocephalus solidus]|uniref:Cysteine string protein n=1 Tax=Schistocephalus solidus TaxID=70667 RepID=A0A183SMW0_SCHSO|nr:unnamed protein product [Schistocephalus solidus]